MASSKGVTTLFCTVSALAPGYDAHTLMAGGAMSGYFSTGSEVSAITPNATMNTLMTIESKGLSIKVLTVITSCL